MARQIFIIAGLTFIILGIILILYLASGDPLWRF